MKNSKLFREIKDLSTKYNSKNTIEINFYSLIEEAIEKFNEETLTQLRETNKNIRLIKFGKDAKVYYIGETKEGKENPLPAVMEGFGLFKNEETKEIYLGFFKDDNFHKGIWVKNKKNYFIGEFKYDTKLNLKEKSLFIGLLINIAEDESISLLFGNLNFSNYSFDGLSIKNDVKAKEIQFDAGVFREGKKDSNDFYTVKLFLDDNGDISSFKIIYADYQKDELVNDTLIQDEFSLIKMNTKNNTFYSILSYDNSIIYIGDFKVSDKDKIDPIFDGEGVMLDCGSGFKYSGQFMDGKKHGKGILFIENKNEAENKNDDKNISQRILDGEFCDDNFVNGNIIEEGKKIIENGVFDENLALKNGKIYYDEDEFYIGDFSNNIRNGKGTYRYKNKYEYHGDWKNGMRDGEGTLFLEDRAKQITGEWTENKLVKVTNTSIDSEE